MDINNIPVLKDLINFWNKLEKAQKRNIIVVVVIVAVGIGALVYFLNRTTYTLLFSGLSADRAQTIVTQLQSQNVPYKISADGSSIYVPENKATTLRLQFASSGVVGATKPGYELFDNLTNMFLTQDEQQIMYQRALEGELEKTIMAMPAIKSVSVNISLPQRSLWTITSTQTAQAAVYLTLKPGYNLSPNQVEAIRQLVAHSVENLSPNNVVIADANSGILTAGSETTSAGSSYLDVKKQLDDLYASKVRDFLAQTWGPDNVLVSADVDVSVNKQNIQSETWGNTATRSVSDTESLNGNTAAGGPVGTSTNVPGAVPSYVYTTTASSTSSYYKQQQVNYEISRTVSQIVPQDVQIKSVKVAVVVDSSVFQNYGITASTVQALVTSAAGLDPARGDVAVVTSMPFATLQRQQEIQQAQQLAKAEQRARLYIYIGAAVLGLLLLVIVFILLRRRGRRPTVIPSPMPAMGGRGGVTVSTQVRQPITFERELTPEEEKIKAALDEVQKSLDEHPNDVGEIVRLWLQEEER
jgi:flagellar M-ring protein FliF